MLRNSPLLILGLEGMLVRVEVRVGGKGRTAMPGTLSLTRTSTLSDEARRDLPSSPITGPESL